MNFIYVAIIVFFSSFTIGRYVERVNYEKGMWIFIATISIDIILVIWMFVFLITQPSRKIEVYKDGDKTIEIYKQERIWSYGLYFDYQECVKK